MAKGQPIRVLLVRGGATPWDDTGRLQGTCDLPLSIPGRERVCGLLESLTGVTFAAAYSSPDEASVETATLIGRATGVKPAPLNDLREMNLGLWEGLTLADLEARFPRACKQWQEDPGSVSPPGGETFAAARDRILATVERILTKARPGSAICLVLRPIALAAVRCWLSGEDSARFWNHIEDSTPLEWRLFGATKAMSRPVGRDADPGVAAAAIRAFRTV